MCCYYSGAKDGEVYLQLPASLMDISSTCSTPATWPGVIGSLGRWMRPCGFCWTVLLVPRPEKGNVLQAWCRERRRGSIRRQPSLSTSDASLRSPGQHKPGSRVCPSASRHFRLGDKSPPGFARPALFWGNKRMSISHLITRSCLYDWEMFARWDRQGGYTFESHASKYM